MSNDPTGALTSVDTNTAVHEELAQRLVRHRVAVMERDPTHALATWRPFAALLTQHILDESELVLPRYAVICEDSPAARGGAPDIVDREHDKLTRHLEDIEKRVLGLRADPAPSNCLALLDRQKILADLLEHHDLRETELVYPRLEPHLSPEERASICRRFRESLS